MLVAGFQGVSTAKDVTTLGRGGSDTTAVALAAAVGAEVCEIYTDVAGVFTRRPADRARRPQAARSSPSRRCSRCRRRGAGVLQLRSVEYARNHGVRIHCRSSFTEEPGTFVVGEEETMERPLITAVTHSRDEARVTLLGVPDHPGVAGRIFTALADANVNVDMIIQNEPVVRGRGGRHVVHRPAHRPAQPRAPRSTPIVGARSASAPSPRTPRWGRCRSSARNEDAPRRRREGLRARSATQGINIEMISTSPIKISCVVAGDARRPRRPRAARARSSSAPTRSRPSTRSERRA